MEHVIRVMDGIPFKAQFRWIPPPLVEDVHAHLWELFNSGMICPSQGTWCKAVVLVQKKDGNLHFCIEFHHLNACTKKDSYPLLIIQETLESLVGAGHFSCLDMKSGFWQIKMDELSKQCTTFSISNLGFFECDCMPFGLCNMPATFQRLMQNCLSELNLTYCLIYPGDIIIFLQMAEEHLHHPCIIFHWFREHNLKLKPSKCDFFRNKIMYLAHRVSKDRVCPSNSNLKAIAECALPQTYKEVHTSLIWWATTGGSSKDLHALHIPLASILPGKGPTGSWSRCHLPRKPWRPLRQENRYAWQCPSWCLLTTLKHSCGDWCIQRWIGGCVVTEASRWLVPPCGPWQQVPNTTWEKLSLYQIWVPGIKMGSYKAL